MKKLFLPVILIVFLTACGGNKEPREKGNSQNTTEATMQEGKDYVLLKRFRLTDETGFNQPVEASSFLLPANWQVNGRINWNATSKCLPEMLQASILAKLPNGDYEIIMLPATQFDWSTDPVYLDAMQRGFNPYSCTIQQPNDAAGYISQTLAPALNAQAKNAAVIEALQQQMDAGAAQMTIAARMGGNNAYSHRGSAAEGLLQFSDGMEGLAFCTLMQTIVTMGGTRGNIAENTQCYVSMRVVIKYQPGNEAEARKIMSTFFSSARINPQWMQGVQSFFAAVTKNAQDENWKRIQISREAQQEIGNNIIRNWEARNSSTTSSGSGDNTGQFGQYLRGVDNWTDDNGNKVELTSGYSNAWSKGDGSYILSNNPAFDPNVELKDVQGWNRLKQ